jgi:hypothetical protein
MINFLGGRRMVPINIDQTKERLGAMELVMLGESVLSVCMIYRELMAEKDEEAKEEQESMHSPIIWGIHPYYYVLVHSFLLIFMLLLLYFHMQPSPADHAFRRSRLHGTAVFLLHKILGLAYLAVGTSIKLVVESVLLNEPLVSAAHFLMGYGVGASILILFGMRWMHYGGRSHINFGDKCMHFGVNPRLDNLASMWWTTICIAGILPLIAVATKWTLKFDAVTLTAIHAWFVFFLVLLETFFSHSLQEGAAVQQVTIHVAGVSHGETQLLTANTADKNSKSYS